MPGATAYDDRHMSDFEGLLWTLDGDPRLSSTIANLTLLDRRPDEARLIRRLGSAAASVPRLRQRVVPSPGGLAPPSWVDVADFDVRDHVRRLDLGKRVGRRALLDATMAAVAEPFDRDRPLWEFVLVDHLADGGAGLLLRIHHTLTDGQGGLRISRHYIDLERDAPDPDPVPMPVAAPAATGVTDGIGRLARRQVDLARRRVADVADLFVHPDELWRRRLDGASALRSAVSQAGIGDHWLSPLWTERSLDRRLDVLDISLDETVTVAHALGVTVNDVFVTGALAAAGDYHRRKGVPTDDLRVAMPVSTRTGEVAGGNMFSPTQTTLPAGEMSQRERVAAVHEALRATKGAQAISLVESLAGTLNLLPHQLLVWAGARAAGSVDFVTSNLRASRRDVYLAGARMEKNYPVGPLAGTAFNITTMSYRGLLCMGVVTDTAAIDDPKLLRRCLERSYRELLALT